METTKLSKRDQLARFFAKLGEDEPFEAVWVWDDYIDAIGAGWESRIYCKLVCDNCLYTPGEIVEMFGHRLGGEQEWFWPDSDHKRVSSNSLGESPYDSEELADYFLEREGDVEFFHDGKIDEILGTSFCA